MAVEIAGGLRPRSLAFLRILSAGTGEEKAFKYLKQCLTVAVQRRNAASVLDTTGRVDFSESNFFF